MSSKLEILYKNNLYALALSLVTHSDQTQSEIHQRYGDYYYERTDYDSAMQQYLQTLGKLEPSYVIRKFLDAQRIHNLTSYLQALHEQGLANGDHTTLLLNCFTKLKDTEKLGIWL